MGTLAPLRYKRGVRMPAFRVQLLDDNAEPVDLSTATAQLVIKKPDGALVTGALTVEASKGWVSRAWGASDLSLAGIYAYEIEVTWPGSLLEIYPSKGYGQIIVEADL